MTGALTAALLGLTLGAKHALEPDHLAAVGTFVAREKTIARAALSGAAWGVGHGALLIVVSSALVALGLRVPDGVAMGLELAVSVVLVGLGVLSLFGHRFGRERHLHAAPPEPASAAAAALEGKAESAPGVARRMLAIGLLHGASGTAALVMLVAVNKFEARSDAFAFVGIFGLASALAMTAVAVVVALPLRTLLARRPAWAPGARRVAGVLSIAAGLSLGWSTLQGEDEAQAAAANPAAPVALGAEASPRPLAGLAR